MTSGVDGLGEAVKKAKTPLLAAGAAAVGLGATVVATRAGSRKRKVLGVSLPGRPSVKMPSLSGGIKMPSLSGNGDLKKEAQKASAKVADAAKRVDQFGQRLSSVATSVRQASESAEEAAKRA